MIDSTGFKNFVVVCFDETEPVNMEFVRAEFIRAEFVRAQTPYQAIIGSQVFKDTKLELPALDPDEDVDDLIDFIGECGLFASVSEIPEESAFTIVDPTQFSFEDDAEDEYDWSDDDVRIHDSEEKEPRKDGEDL